MMRSCVARQEPYRSFRELSLARSVDLVTWCPPTFVGNSGIERSNGHRGFALFSFAAESRVYFAATPARTTVIPRESGVSSNSWPRGAIIRALEYWITRFRG